MDREQDRLPRHEQWRRFGVRVYNLLANPVTILSAAASLFGFGTFGGLVGIAAKSVTFIAVVVLVSTAIFGGPGVAGRVRETHFLERIQSPKWRVSAAVFLLLAAFALVGRAAYEVAQPILPPNLVSGYAASLPSSVREIALETTVALPINADPMPTTTSIQPILQGIMTNGEQLVEISVRHPRVDPAVVTWTVPLDEDTGAFRATVPVVLAEGTYWVYLNDAWVGGFVVSSQSS